MTREEKQEYAVKLLRDKAKILDRLPQKADFDSNVMCFIKQKLGPWPHALEAAGLKKAKPSKIIKQRGKN